MVEGAPSAAAGFHPLVAEASFYEAAAHPEAAPSDPCHHHHVRWTQTPLAVRAEAFVHLEAVDGHRIQKLAHLALFLQEAVGDHHHEADHPLIPSPLGAAEADLLAMAAVTASDQIR